MDSVQDNLAEVFISKERLELQALIEALKDPFIDEETRVSTEIKIGELKNKLLAYLREAYTAGTTIYFDHGFNDSLLIIDDMDATTGWSASGGGSVSNE